MTHRTAAPALFLLVLLTALFFAGGAAWGQFPKPQGGGPGMTPPPQGQGQPMAAPGQPQTAQGQPLTTLPSAQRSETAAPGAVATGAPAPSNATLIFFLVVFLCLFGYHLFTSYNLNSRLDRLEERLARHGSSRPLEPKDLLSFSWEGILEERARKPSLLAGDLLKVKPGLVLLGLPGCALLTAVCANAAKHLLDEDDAAILVVTRTVGGVELGRALLSLESGKSWASLDTALREKAVKEMAGAIARYEGSLFHLTELAATTGQLYEFCLKALEEKDLRAIVLEEDALVRDEGESVDDFLETLRLIALRCHVPLVVCAFPKDESSLWHGRDAHGEKFAAVASLEEEGAQNALRLTFAASHAGEESAALTLEPHSGLLRRKA